jgi:hypothetical protein
MGGALKFRIGAFARSARSGGRAVLLDASRELLARQQRRTPHPALLRRCLATSTLGGRDKAKVGMEKRIVKLWARLPVYGLSMDSGLSAARAR